MSVLFWVTMAVGLAVVEILSLTFFPIFFTASAIIALVLQLLDAPDWAQWLAFGAGGLILSGALRPIAKRNLESGPTLKSHSESLVGRTAVVTAAVDGRAGVGSVTIDGQTWSARPSDGVSEIARGTDVLIAEIKGATVVVTPPESTGVPTS